MNRMVIGTFKEKQLNYIIELFNFDCTNDTFQNMIRPEPESFIY